VSTEFKFLRQPLVCGGIDDTDRASIFVSISDVEKFAGGVIAEVIYVVLEVDGRRELERGCVVDVQLPRVASHEKPVQLLGIDDPLRLCNPSDAVRPDSRRKIENLFCVVPQSGDKQPALGIET
jgi:hypothetical protein